MRSKISSGLISSSDSNRSLSLSHSDSNVFNASKMESQSLALTSCKNCETLWLWLKNSRTSRTLSAIFSFLEISFFNSKSSSYSPFFGFSDSNFAISKRTNSFNSATFNASSWSFFNVFCASKNSKKDSL